MKLNITFPVTIAALLLLMSWWLSPAATAQTINVFAGTGSPGYSGDGGPASAATFNKPFDVKRDGAGNFYIADNSNFRIRKITPAGIVSTVAGSGTSGYSGDGGPATAAKFGYVQSINIDAAGNLYIGDLTNGTIRKVTVSGIITTCAGTGTIGSGSDSVPATASTLGTPLGIRVSPGGELYFADFFNSRIRKIAASGIITTVAGDGTAGFAGDGGPATAAQINHPSDIDFDASGNMYIADWDNGRVRRVSASGTITTIAGNGTAGFSGDGGPATAAAFNKPGRIAVGSAGIIFVVDENNYRVRKISGTGTIQTFAGTATAGCTGNRGPATAAQLLTTRGICVGPLDVLCIASADCQQIRKIDTSATSFAPTNTMAAASGELQVHPNPNKGSFSIALTSATNAEVQVVVTDATGRRISTLTLAGNKETEVTLNVPAGIYFLSAPVNAHRLTTKIVIE